MVALVVRGEGEVLVVEGIGRDLNRSSRPRDEIFFARGEVDERSLGMCESIDALKGGTTPESDTRTMKSCNVSTLR